MYKVILVNDSVETLIHYPTSEKDAPHINKLDLKEGLSMVDSLSFVLYPNNDGYDKIFELTTKIKVIDTRDNSVHFTGRILDIDENMESSGLFYKKITCEGALSFLNDSKQRANAFATANVATFLTQILAIHNSKVDVTKQINVGNVDVIGSLAYSCNFETTLSAILKVKEKLGGDIRVREENGVMYLDWLQSFSVDTVDVTLGENMKDMIKGKDITSLGTRIIPLGANNLTISSVNGGIDYIEDSIAVNTYGVVEKTVEYKDITDANELYSTCMADLSKYTQPLYLLESNALDLSFLSGNKAEQFVLGVNLHLFNPIIAVDSIYKVVQIDLDLLQAYNPKLTIANFPVKSSNQFNDLRQSSVQNNGVYNNVQIGDAFGIRAVRSDNKVTTTINATDGISIQNENKKVFYVDTNGILRAIDGIFDDVTANNMTANYGTYNNIVANLMKTSNTTNYIIMHDQYIEFYHNNEKIIKLGFDSNISSPSIMFYKDYDGLHEAGFGMDSFGNLIATGNISFENTINFQSSAKKGGQEIATEEWVNSQGFTTGTYATQYDIDVAIFLHEQRYHT